MGLFDVDFDLNFDSSAFANELVAGADIDDASKAALAAVLGNQNVKAKLKNSVALRSEAQRAMDRARTVAREAESIRDQNFKWANDNKPAIEQWIANGGGQGGGNSTITAPSGDVLTRAEVKQLFDEMGKKFSDTLAAQDESYVSLIADTVDLTQKYSKLFDGESLPYGELQKYALEKRMTLRNAFDTFIAPKLDEKRKTEFASAIAAAREEGRIEALSQREEMTTAEPGSGDLGSAFKDVLLGRRTTTLKDAAGKELSGEDAFVKNWNSTRGFTQPVKDH